MPVVPFNVYKPHFYSDYVPSFIAHVTNFLYAARAMWVGYNVRNQIMSNFFAE